ncbi:MAG: hypothetical protein A3K90_01935 [Pelodictyon luteolum]|uniref:Uncharacterized protein n=1 Tax=Pelodictyon luteolum TaxID=1100 RepID=A0A165L325_PELLU|nr:hypothetical protein [Pelodictyon luteolum]KZK73514.1 MAG: hypothetical protein A3K90_01935 [Pelodictyon luteolum]
MNAPTKHLLIFIPALCLLLLLPGASPSGSAVAVPPLLAESSGGGVRHEGRLRFKDEDGDGINDLIRDSDGDGIPDGRDGDGSGPGDWRFREGGLQGDGRSIERQGNAMRTAPSSGRPAGSGGGSRK